MPADRSFLRRLPAVEALVQQMGEVELPRPLVVACVRETLARFRRLEKIPEPATIFAEARRAVHALARTRIQPVINATGVVIHTNLGRSPLGGIELLALKDAALHYCNLELDLNSGVRGRRGDYVERCLAHLCHAEAAAIVNNCAAALVLMLRHFTAAKKEVVISRGELVQIGGGFRIPDILETGGARLREVGTTNKTTLNDYARAIGRDTGLVLKVHRSNFFMEGFVESPATTDLATLCRKRRVPLVEDLGSGAVFDTVTLPGLEHEPTPAEVLRAGADLVCFSGDKLFGGPQAGIVAGRAKHVRALKADPFFRALRCDKLILAALQATAERYLARETCGLPPIHQLLETSVEALRKRARKLIRRLAGIPATAQVVETEAQVGGGTLPRSAVPSIAVELRADTLPAAELARRLRLDATPIIGAVVRNAVRLDLRSVFPFEDEQIARAVHRVFAETSAGAAGDPPVE